MFGKNFPISEYLRPNIIDATTVSRKGGWWTAVLLIRDPKSQKPYLALYRWQKRGGDWKKSSSFKINSPEQLAKIMDSLTNLASHLEAPSREAE